MSKLALVVRRADFQKLIETFPEPRKEGDQKVRMIGFMDEEMFKLPTELLPREQVENDPTYLQLIPYGILLSPDEDNYEHTFLSYVRGKKGTETRLHDLRSLGIGGHIEEPVTEQKDLFSVIWDAFLREMKEEIGVELPPAHEAMVRDEVRKNCRWAYSNQEAVHEVHLGINFSLWLQTRPELKLEEGVILDPKWMTMHDMVTQILHNGFQLEEWSDMFLLAIYQESVGGIPSVDAEEPEDKPV